MKVSDTGWQRNLKPGTLLHTRMLDRQKTAIVIASQAHVYMGLTQLRVSVLYDGSIKVITMDTGSFIDGWHIIDGT